MDLVFHTLSLHRVHTFQRSVECKAPTSDEQIPIERDQKNGIMAMFSTADNTQISKVNKPDVGQGVGKFSNVKGHIVVLI